ncbi:MAG: cation diffusion facilitator family transporter [Francisella sp.]
MKDKYYIVKKVTIVGLVVNTLLAISKTLIGIIGSSSALFADGIHSFSDLLSDIMVLFAAKYASKGEDHNHPYGHERLETFATLILSALLIFIGFMIVYHSLFNLIIGNNIVPDKFTVYAAIFSIIGNEFIYQYTIRAANKINSDMLRANAWHSRSDMWSSVVVLVGLFGSFLGFAWMDTIAAAIVCFMIVKIGVKWGYSAVAELVDEGVDDQTRMKIKELIAKTQGVKDFHYLRTRKMAGKILLDVHILVDKFCTASEGHYIAEVVKSNIYHNIDNIKDITVHVDVTNHESGVIKLDNFEPSREEILKKVEEIFATNNINVEDILDNKISIYYLDNKILVDLYVKNTELSNNLQNIVQNLSNLSYKQFNLCIRLYADISNI